MSALAVIAFAVLCAFLVVYIQQSNPTFAILVGFSACMVVLLFLSSGISLLFENLQTAFSFAVPDEFSVLIKIVGLSILSQTAQDVCLDAGQRALAGKVDLCGRIAILLAALPLLQSVLAILSELFL